ncbi:uncharacterized protein LOC131927541 [Physella acuta]|uniref:uncharacterized protein LOC131927541 n=1 Tax=Physella acuta TaxID=109671 RepID=UPI0027DC889B|nr:uncharacterized protein LOC131927541 [Physella acuta]XP_059139240.1 uncharacterized protein LOC131927541 [Physella acuta]XP_059139248.1 uncharacterized protein LOC131927541 [Physella acuta]
MSKSAEPTISPEKTGQDEKRMEQRQHENCAGQKDDDEFQIAADLTLYANPLRCLHTHHKKTETHSGNSSHKTETEEAAEQAGDIIAADLTMYGSPLDDN